MSEEPWLLPNLGGEEGPDWRARRADPRVRAVARLWQILFGAGARLLDEDGDPRSRWPAALGPAPEAPCFPWLACDDPADAVVPWIATRDAASDPGVGGRRLVGPPPAVVERVADKAFAHRTALAEGLVPRALQERIAVLEPEALADADALVARIEASVAGWPEWTRGRFTLKPRLGSSARGRVAGAAGEADRTSLRGALPRLASRGGVLLEPWLARTADLSVQMHVGAGREVVLLGSLEQVLAPSGRFLGQRGEVDSRGRVFSGSEHEETMREAAAALARAAAAEGYAGPCGVDGFAFRGPDEAEILRPAVELNARFTAGLVALGLVRRALPLLRAQLGLEPGRRLAFLFAVDAPDAADLAGGLAHVVPLWGEGDPLRPALVFAPAREALDPVAHSLTGTGRERA